MEQVAVKESPGALTGRKPRRLLGGKGTFTRRAHSWFGSYKNCAPIAIHELANEMGGNAELGWRCGTFIVSFCVRETTGQNVWFITKTLKVWGRGWSPFWFIHKVSIKMGFVQGSWQFLYWDIIDVSLYMGMLKVSKNHLSIQRCIYMVESSDSGLRELGFKSSFTCTVWLLQATCYLEFTIFNLKGSSL